MFRLIFRSILCLFGYYDLSNKITIAVSKRDFYNVLIYKLCVSGSNNMIFLCGMRPSSNDKKLLTQFYKAQPNAPARSEIYIYSAVFDISLLGSFT